MEILTEQGRAALARAAAEADPTSLGAAERLRREFEPALAAEALTQVALRRRAQGKFPDAEEMFLTSDGLQQATRPAVAEWRARRFADAGITEVWDLGCGLGADAMAIQQAGLMAQGVEADEQTAAFATANLALVGGPAVLQARAEDVEVPEGAGVFLDPARRNARGRTWDVADFTPPWTLVEEYLSSDHFTCVKLGPGLPKELIPDGVAATWVSERGSVAEVSLWNRLEPGYSAVVFPRDGSAPVEVRATEAPRELPVGEVGRFLIEPDNAVIRAGLVGEVAPGRDVWLLDPHLAYLSADEPLDSPLADCFEVTEALPYDQKSIRAHVKQQRIGTLEIKCRGIDVDPAALRRQLKPKGPAAATLVLSRTPNGAVAVFAHRV
ncbi:class I SAM-dependent methyltransferase [Tessaracoccus terricola]